MGSSTRNNVGLVVAVFGACFAWWYSKRKPSKKAASADAPSGPDTAGNAKIMANVRAGGGSRKKSSGKKSN